MVRSYVLTALLLVLPVAAAGQAPATLHIRVSLFDAEQKPVPVPRHRLLISDNPATMTPREVVTGPDGTAVVTLPPGNYTVESDKPILVRGRAYHWTQTLDVPAGRDLTLELTAKNAVAESASGTAAGASGSPPELDASTLFDQWKDSIVALWTAATRGTGFVVDRDQGLVATSQRVVGDAGTLEVQLSPTVKVAGRVVAAEPGRDVAIVRIDPGVVGAIAAVPLGCASPSTAPLAEHQEVFTIAWPFREPKAATSATLGRVGPHALETDFYLSNGSAGGPVFTAAGSVAGITSVVDGSDDRGSPDYRVVRTGDVCAVLATATKALGTVPAPAGAQLPVEPARPYPTDALEQAALSNAANHDPYQLSSSDFDVAFITPVKIYAAQHEVRPKSLPVRGGRDTAPETNARKQALVDFGRWSEYVAQNPPVLLVRVTPRLVEGFWKMVARGAAQTQGMSLPAFKHFKAGFSRLQAFCGDAAVTPIHPFTLQTRMSDRDTIDEGLYVFDPGALAPTCGTVRLVLYSQKSPDTGDTLTVDGKLVEQLWQEFAPYRDAR